MITDQEIIDSQKLKVCMSVSEITFLRIAKEKQFPFAFFQQGKNEGDWLLGGVSMAPNFTSTREFRIIDLTFVDLGE